MRKHIYIIMVLIAILLVSGQGCKVAPEEAKPTKEIMPVTITSSVSCDDIENHPSYHPSLSLEANINTICGKECQDYERESGMIPYEFKKAECVNNKIICTCELRELIGNF